MSDHERFEELLSALLDGELNAEEEAEMRAHMAQCAECAAMYEAFAAVGAALKADADDVPDTLHDGIMSKVRMAEKARKTQNKIVRLRPILTAAACLVVLVGTVLALKNTVGMRGKSAAPENAEAPAMAFSASGSTAAGGAAEAPMLLAAPAPEAAAEDAGVTESAANDIMYAKEAPEAGSAVQDAAPPEPMPDIVSVSQNGAPAATDPRAAKQNPRLAEAKSFTMRLEAVSDGELSGVVTDEGDQSLVQTGEQITVLFDGAELMEPEIGGELVVYIDSYTTLENGRIGSTVMIRSAE